MHFITFTLIIDDIIFPDGRTAMGMLGGGGPQTAFGMRLWAESVGLVGGVGADLPDEALAWLAAAGIDTGGLRHSPQWPTPRAWQVCEADGRRTQVWRIKGPAIGAQLGRSVANLPASYQNAVAVHLGAHPEEPDLEFIRALRKRGATVSVEPFRAALRPMDEAQVGALVSAGQIFSPNEAEAISLVGPGHPQQLVERLVAAGAEVVALRLGERGALVQHAVTGESWQIPAYPTTVVDPTGAGNAFCGGFLAGWLNSGDLRQAGLCGVVAASFLVEQVGLPPFGPDWQEEARRRLAVVGQLAGRG